MFNGVPVLSVVLVCAIVFSGCVAQDGDTIHEESFCQRLLDFVKEKEPCIPDADAEMVFWSGEWEDTA